MLCYVFKEIIMTIATISENAGYKVCLEARVVPLVEDTYLFKLYSLYGPSKNPEEARTMTSITMTREGMEKLRDTLNRALGEMA